LLQRSASMAQNRRRRSSLGLPGSHRRDSGGSRRRSSLAAILEEESGSRAWVKNSLSIFLVIAAGTAGWAIAWQSNVWRPAPEEGGHDGASDDTPLGAEILGYISAVCYLGARIPQIIKNQRERSCEGLSLLFFLLSLLGNFTYGAGVCTGLNQALVSLLTCSCRYCSIHWKGATCSRLCLGSSARWARWLKMQSFSSNFASLRLPSGLTAQLSNSSKSVNTHMATFLKGANPLSCLDSIGTEKKMRPERARKCHFCGAAQKKKNTRVLLPSLHRHFASLGPHPRTS
jgi:hypothetical protein